MIQSTKIICGFPGVGKSSYVKITKGDTLDSDSSKFPKEGFPENYLDHIVSNIGKVKTILVSTHKDVIQGLKDRGLNFLVVYPNINCNSIYQLNYLRRGSGFEFANNIGNHWNEWINDIKMDPNIKKLELPPHMYLSDVIPFIESMEGISNIREHETAE